MKVVKRAISVKLHIYNQNKELKDIKAHAAESGDISLWVCGCKGHLSLYTVIYLLSLVYEILMRAAWKLA